MQEIREWFDGLVALSGSIANGWSILAAQALRADFAYMGSAFIATREANANEAYKQGIVEGSAEGRSEEHTSELQSLMRISYAVFCLKKKKTKHHTHISSAAYSHTVNMVQ